jgi:hypothetical protein
MSADSRFTLYDLVVDLIPGVTAILLFFWIYGSAELRELVQVYGTALPTVALLAVGYVVGRLIHSISNADLVEKVGIGIYNWIPGFGSLEPKDRRFSNRLAHLKDNEDEESLEKKIGETALESIFDEVELDVPDVDYEEGDAEAFERDSIGSIPDLRYARYVADTLTYQHQSLSWKYGILATFFRNMWPILIVASFGYLINLINRYPDLNLASVGIFFGLLVSGVVCIQQRFKFKRRQIRTMINEIALSTG